MQLEANKPTSSYWNKMGFEEASLVDLTNNDFMIWLVKGYKKGYEIN